MKANDERRKATVGQVDPITRHASPITAFVALGRNLDDPPVHIHRALEALAGLPATRVVRHSSLYRNPPAGYRDQPDFVNAVAQIETRLGPRELLDRLLAIEEIHGRVRAAPDGPRTLDLDILLYGGRTVQEPGLTIPHPRMLERAFVLVPLAEIAPGARVPGSGRAADLVKKVDVSGMIRIPEPGHE
jgi:2-amino-4-hydroxy-6-hydroxymethyldihydropteridine diphosphokinase